MSGSNSIRWREKDEQELKRLIRNAKAKVNRQRKKLVEAGRRFEAAALPKFPSFTEAKKSIETRKDFKSLTGEIKNYISTGKRFKVDKVTQRSLEATVEKFNTKIDRLSVKPKRRDYNIHQSYVASLPEKITVEALIKNASTKEALKRDIESYKGFLRRGAEQMVEIPDTKYNITLTKWQKSLMEDTVSEINAKREEERQEWLQTEVKYGGKEAGYTQGQARMDKGDFDKFYPMKAFTEAITNTEIRSKFRTMMRERQPGYWDMRAELARINYTEKLNTILGNHKLGKKLLNTINKLPIADFKRALKGDDDLFALLYDLETQSDNFDIVLEQIWNEWIPDKDMHEELDKKHDGNE